MYIYGVFLNFHLEEHIKKVEYLKKYISKHKLNKINRLKKQEDRMRSIIGDILVRWLICEKYQLLNEELEFSTNRYGKPFITNKNIDIYFNISHSGSWVVAATSSFQIGIDIEKVMEIDITLAKEFFTSEENSVLMKRLPEEQLHFFYELWTLKESYVKAIGKGLSIPLDSFSIKIDNGNITIIPEFTYNFKKYHLEDNYKLAICSLENAFPDFMEVISVEQLYFSSIFSKA